MNQDSHHRKFTACIKKLVLHISNVCQLVSNNTIVTHSYVPSTGLKMYFTETGSYTVVHAFLELMAILLPQTPQFWNYKLFCFFLHFFTSSSNLLAQGHNARR